MGTNYYLHHGGWIGRGAEELHIGKSSAGWCFALHVIPDMKINDLDDWDRMFDMPKNTIKNEYGDVVEKSEMLKIITERAWHTEEKAPLGYTNWEEFHRTNYSTIGPNGLLRHQIDGKHCIGHGNGTWDLMIGKFS